MFSVTCVSKTINTSSAELALVIFMVIFWFSVKVETLNVFELATDVETDKSDVNICVPFANKFILQVPLLVKA